jgi:SOS-response transcriptional repressor LexA
MTEPHSLVNRSVRSIYDVLSMASDPSFLQTHSMEASWIKAELEKPGRSQSALARFLGLDPASVNRIANGTRQIKAQEAEKIKAYLAATQGSGVLSHGTQPEPARMIPVIGTVEAGAWRESANDYMEQLDIPVVDHRLFDGEVFALRVAGPSMNLMYPDGSFVVVRPFQGGALPIGKRVEMTVKELTQLPNGALQLWPRSSDPRFQSAVPYEAEDSTVEIIGRVIATLGFEE